MDESLREPEQRAAQNQLLFREVNERIASPDDSSIVAPAAIASIARSRRTPKGEARARPTTQFSNAPSKPPLFASRRPRQPRAGSPWPAARISWPMVAATEQPLPELLAGTEFLYPTGPRDVHPRGT